jgi:hypothetical protein
MVHSKTTQPFVFVIVTMVDPSVNPIGSLLPEESLAGLLQILRIVTSCMAALMEDYLLVKIIEMELPEPSMYGLIIQWDMELRA